MYLFYLLWLLWCILRIAFKCVLASEMVANVVIKRQMRSSKFMFFRDTKGSKQFHAVLMKKSAVHSSRTNCYMNYLHGKHRIRELFTQAWGENDFKDKIKISLGQRVNMELLNWGQISSAIILQHAISPATLVHEFTYTRRFDGKKFDLARDKNVLCACLRLRISFKLQGSWLSLLNIITLLVWATKMLNDFAPSGESARQANCKRRAWDDV
jgi:hypothetical protein